MADEADTVTLESSTDLPSNDTSINLVCFIVGETLSSYLHLKEKVAAYEKAKSVPLMSHCNIKTVQVASKSIPLKTAKVNENLVYFYINLSCVFDGKKYQDKGNERDLIRGQY